MVKRVAAAILAAVTVISMLFAGCGSGSDQQVYVESVAQITGMGYSGLNNRFSGVVVSGSTQTINKDKDKRILELYVSVGDRVNAGDVLFSYDVQAVELALKKLELEREQLENTLELLAENIEKYEKKVESAPESKKLEYEVQLQTYQIEQKEKTLELDAKLDEIDKTTDMLSNSDVVSKVTGVVQSINQETAGETDENGKIIPFMTIVETGAYRVKGTASELDIYGLREGSRVIIRSRVDDRTWMGTVDFIEWENPEKNQEDMYYSDSENMASKYPFYVSLDSTEGLIMGQHVYVEPATAEAGGMMLPEYYINDADGDAWVWAVNGRGRIEKREVELGSYNEELWCYEILDGLTPDDYIAFPDDTLKEGMTAVYSDMLEPEDGEFAEGEEFDDSMSYEGSVEVVG